MMTDQEADAGELDDAPEPDLTPLTGPVTADDIARSADDHERAAAAATAQAAHDRTEAEEILAAAQERIARIEAEAEARMRPLADSAGAAEREAARLGERATRLARAAAAAVNAEEAAEHVAALEAERDNLAGQQADLGRRAAELEAEALELDPQLAAAREAGALDEMTSLRNRLDSIRDLVADLRARQAPLTARLAELGTGAETYQTHPHPLPALATARRQAVSAERSVRGGINFAFPERPEAVDDRRRQEFREAWGHEEPATQRPGPVSVQQAGGQAIVRRG